MHILQQVTQGISQPWYWYWHSTVRQGLARFNLIEDASALLFSHLAVLFIYGLYCLSEKVNMYVTDTRLLLLGGRGGGGVIISKIILSPRVLPSSPLMDARRVDLKCHKVRQRHPFNRSLIS